MSVRIFAVYGVKLINAHTSFLLLQFHKGQMLKVKSLTANSFFFYWSHLCLSLCITQLLTISWGQKNKGWSKIFFLPCTSDAFSKCSPDFLSCVHVCAYIWDIDLTSNIYRTWYHPVMPLTVTPVLDFEPLWFRNDRPTFKAVLHPVFLSKGHWRKHVRHIVALITQIDLCASLKPKHRQGKHLDVK